MDLDVFEIKAKLVDRVREINEQLDLLNKIGMKLCNEDHCEIGFEIKLVDQLKKEQEEAEQETHISPLLMSSWLASSVDEDKYTDSVFIELLDRSAISLIGFCIKELEDERKQIMKELEAV